MTILAQTEFKYQTAEEDRKRILCDFIDHFSFLISQGGKVKRLKRKFVIYI